MSPGIVILNCAQLDSSVAAVDHIARLQLCMRRGGYRLCLANVSDELSRVIELAGLEGCLGVEVQGQPEQREQLRGVEEEGDLPYPPA
jgi:anti-anti-sigma regulatory factor